MKDKVSTDSQPNSEFSPLVTETEQGYLNKNRMFRTAIPASYFVRLEHEAAKRGMTSFKFAGLILRAYLDKNCPVSSGGGS